MFSVVQTLLRHGANPDLRDEDGKTPLDKARERGHSEVVAILQSPGEFKGCSVDGAADEALRPLQCVDAATVPAFPNLKSLQKLGPNSRRVDESWKHDPLFVLHCRLYKVHHVV